MCCVDGDWLATATLAPCTTDTCCESKNILIIITIVCALVGNFSGCIPPEATTTTNGLSNDCRRK